MSCSRTKIAAKSCIKNKYKSQVLVAHTVTLPTWEAQLRRIGFKASGGQDPISGNPIWKIPNTKQGW
jgi:hypothetical protein